MTDRTTILKDILHFLGRFDVEGYEIKNTAMNTEDGKAAHVLTIRLSGGSK